MIQNYPNHPTNIGLSLPQNVDDSKIDLSQLESFKKLNWQNNHFYSSHKYSTLFDVQKDASALAEKIYHSNPNLDPSKIKSYIRIIGESLNSAEGYKKDFFKYRIIVNKKLLNILHKNNDSENQIQLKDLQTLKEYTSKDWKEDNHYMTRVIADVAEVYKHAETLQSEIYAIHSNKNIYLDLEEDVKKNIKPITSINSETNTKFAVLVNKRLFSILQKPKKIKDIEILKKINPFANIAGIKTSWILHGSSIQSTTLYAKRTDAASDAEKLSEALKNAYSNLTIGKAEIGTLSQGNYQSLSRGSTIDGYRIFISNNLLNRLPDQAEVKDCELESLVEMEKLYSLIRWVGLNTTWKNYDDRYIKSDQYDSIDIVYHEAKYLAQQIFIKARFNKILDIINFEKFIFPIRSKAKFQIIIDSNLMKVIQELRPTMEKEMEVDEELELFNQFNHYSKKAGFDAKWVIDNERKIKSKNYECFFEEIETFISRILDDAIKKGIKISREQLKEYIRCQSCLSLNNKGKPKFIVVDRNLLLLLKDVFYKRESLEQLNITSQSQPPIISEINTIQPYSNDLESKHGYPQNKRQIEITLCPDEKKQKLEGQEFKQI